MTKRSPGVSAGLSRDGILAAALAIADAEGLRRLTMRRLADSLGVEPMSIYGHVPDKTALLDGLVEAVLSLAADLDIADDAPWQEGVRGFAEGLLDAVRAHPGVHSLLLTTQGETERNLAAVEKALETLGRAGFTLPLAVSLLRTVTEFTVAHAISDSATDGGGHRPESAMAEHPLASAVTATDSFDAFTIGLTAILVGFDALRRGVGGAAAPQEPAPRAAQALG